MDPPPPFSIISRRCNRFSSNPRLLPLRIIGRGNRSERLERDGMWNFVFRNCNRRSIFPRFRIRLEACSNSSNLINGGRYDNIVELNSWSYSRATWIDSGLERIEGCKWLKINSLRINYCGNNCWNENLRERDIPAETNIFHRNIVCKTSINTFENYQCTTSFSAPIDSPNALVIFIIRARSYIKEYVYAKWPARETRFSTVPRFQTWFMIATRANTDSLQNYTDSVTR